jgi:hypothetical protein
LEARLSKSLAVCHQKATDFTQQLSCTGNLQLSFIVVEPSGVIRNMSGRCPVLHQPFPFHMKEEEMEQWLTFVTWFFWDTVVSACTCDEVI